MSDNELMVAFAGNIVEAEFVKSLLEGAGIPCYLKDEFIGTIAPFVEPAGQGAVKVVIRSSDLDKAKPIIDDYLKGETTDGE